jgi:PEP-CTERM motif
LLHSPLLAIRAVYRRPLVIAAAVAALLGATQAADAALIQNGNFETGSLSSWSTSGNVSIATVPFFGEGTTTADGNYFAVFNGGNGPTNGVLSQSFAAIGGTQYSLTYNYGANGGAIQSITAAIKAAGGSVVATQFSTLPAASSALSAFTLTFFAASTANLTLSFTDFSGNPTNSTDGFVDGVSLTAVPEPSSLAVMGIGLLFGYSTLRSRRRTQG